MKCEEAARTDIMKAKQMDELSRKITGPVPFWFLNGPVTREQIALEMDMFQSKGVREVIVHPRYGLNVDYPADSWFEVFRWCLEEARSRGMFVWIYDELNWPSGTAGMTVQARNPEFAGQYLSVSVREPGEGPSQFSPQKLLIAARIQGGRVTKTTWVRTPESLRDLGPDWSFFECEVKRDRFYIDTLSKAAVDAFKKSTYDEYYRRFGDEFGKTIRAVFTDEPSIYWVSVGYDDWNLPYTDLLFSTFAERYGYLAQPLIPFLYYPGREAAVFRSDFWEHVSNLFSENYHGNLSSWCKDHGVIYTGHNNHEEPLRYQIRFQGNMFATMHKMDVPGVDHLGKTTLGNSWISIIGHKIASSAAHIKGKSRVMSESFGVTGWDTTFLDLKKIVDWQFALGINLLIPHAVYHSTGGPRKRESPPSFFHQSPHWEDFDAFSAYVDRLTDALSGGRHVCRILILYPLTALWNSYQTNTRTPEMDYLENFLNTLCLELMRFHLDFDLVDFQTLQSAELKDNKILLSDERYDVLIIPPSQVMRPAEQKRIQEIANSGVVTCVLYRAGEQALASQPEHGNVSFVATEDVRSMAVQLSGLFEDDIRLSGRGHEDVLLLRRKKENEDVCFLVNTAESDRRLKVSLPGSTQVAARSPEDGSIVPLTLHNESGRTETQISLGAFESMLLRVGAAENASSTEPEVSESLNVPNLSVAAPFNVALDFDFAYTSADGSTQEIDVREHPVYYPINWDPNPADYSAWAGEYTTVVDIDVEPSTLRIVLDEEYAEHELYVNNRRATLRKANPHLLDWSDVEPDVSDLLVKGRNEFRVVTKTKLSEPIRVVGDFAVMHNGNTVRLEPADAETCKFEMERQYPYFSGAVTYRTEFEMSDMPERVFINLGDARDAVAVYVNGELAGKKLWPPYRVDITNYVRLGMNELTIEVRNNLANMLLGQPRPFGLRSTPTLEIAR